MTGVAKSVAGIVMLMGCMPLLAAQERRAEESVKPTGELPVGVSMAERPEVRFGEPPRVAISREELAAQKASPEAAELKAEAVRQAERYLTDPVVLPDGHGSWTFYYANPVTGTRLKPRSAEEHEDPKTGEIFSDERTRAAYRTQLHYRAESAALALAWAWVWTGEEKYAKEVHRILTKLAADYPNYPARLDRWDRRGFFARWGGRRYVQALDEASGVIPLAKAYDLTRDSSVYSDADHTAIQRDFFRGTANSLLRFNQGISNHQTWYNAGLMAIAGVLGDEALARRVVNMRGGYLDQLRRSVGNDGLWWEGTIAYHNYALRAMMNLVEMGERYGLPLAEEPRFRAMFTAPVATVFPDGRFPAINDSDPMPLDTLQSAWEWAAKRWHDPVIAGLLANPRKLPESALTSQNLPDAGLAILRTAGGKTAAYLDYGPHGGSHGHFDKLNLILFAERGGEWLPDPGRLSYSNPEYKTWVKTTAAHNTVVINERNQYPATGKLLYLENGDTYTAAGAEVRGAYEGTILRRHLLLTPEMLVDLFEVLAPRRSTLDLITHAQPGSVAPLPPAGSSQPFQFGNRDGYGHLAPAMLYPEAPALWRFTNLADDQLIVHLLPEEGEELIATEGIGYRVDERTPTLVRRRFARSTTFAAVYDLTGADRRVRAIAPLPGGGPGIVVTTDRAVYTIEPERGGLRVDTQKLPPEAAK